MATGGNDGKGPRPADERDRGLLFGLSEDAEDAGEGPGASPDTDEAPPGIAAALAGIDARLGRLEAALSEWDEELPADGGSEPGLSDGVARIVEAADRIVGAADTVAEIERTSGEAARFTHDTKEATGVLQAEAGKQIAGLKQGRLDLEKAVAALASRADGLKEREDALGKGIGELRALWKSVSETSGRLAAEVRTLSSNYRNWKDEATAHRKDMASLSGALLQGDARMAESVSENAAAQLEISSKTLGTVQKFSRENDRLLERMGAAGEELLGALREEAGRIRRWTVPSLSAALVVVALSFPVLGAWSQSRIGVFAAYDDTGGLKQAVWDRQGKLIEECIDASRDHGRPVGCRLRIDARGYGAARARLPPVPGGG